MHLYKFNCFLVICSYQENFRQASNLGRLRTALIWRKHFDSHVMKKCSERRLFDSFSFSSFIVEVCSSHFNLFMPFLRTGLGSKPHFPSASACLLRMACYCMLLLFCLLLLSATSSVQTHTCLPLFQPLPAQHIAIVANQLQYILQLWELNKLTIFSPSIDPKFAHVRTSLSHHVHMLHGQETPDLKWFLEDRIQWEPSEGHILSYICIPLLLRCLLPLGD